jgi:serine phosphatase RsbU (regulator of sigma subunit)
MEMGSDHPWVGDAHAADCWIEKPRRFQYSERFESELKSGDRIVFFTDGFPEAHPPGATGRLLGFDGFIGWLDPRPPQPAAAVEALFKRLDDLTGGRLEDDATVFIADVV